MSIQYHLPIESNNRQCHRVELVHQYLQSSPSYPIEDKPYNLCYLDQDLSGKQEATFIFSVKPISDIDLYSLETFRKEQLKELFNLEPIGKIQTVNYEKRHAYLDDGTRIDFNHLIVSTGAASSQNKKELMNSLTTLNKALRMRKAKKKLLNPTAAYSSDAPSNITKDKAPPLSKVFANHIPSSSPLLPSLSFFISDNPIHVVKP